MTNVIDFKNCKDENKANSELFDYNKYYSDKFANKFGTFHDWNNEDIWYLLEQLKNHMYDCDEEGAFPALVGLDIVLSCYQGSDDDALSVYLWAVSTVTGFLSSYDEESSLTDQHKVFDVISKYANSFRVYGLVRELTLGVELQNGTLKPMDDGNLEFVERILPYFGRWDHFCNDLEKIALRRNLKILASHIRLGFQKEFADGKSLHFNEIL